jgi:hypothetical protein
MPNCSSQRTLHELYFHHLDEKQLLEKRVRGAMHDLSDRLVKFAVAPTGSAIAKRQKVATELKSISNLVEEMLSIAKESYSASLAASLIFVLPHLVLTCPVLSCLASSRLVFVLSCLFFTFV